MSFVIGARRFVVVAELLSWAVWAQAALAARIGTGRRGESCAPQCLADAPAAGEGVAQQCSVGDTWAA